MPIYYVQVVKEIRQIVEVHVGHFKIEAPSRVDAEAYAEFLHDQDELEDLVCFRKEDEVDEPDEEELLEVKAWELKPEAKPHVTLAQLEEAKQSPQWPGDTYPAE